ncbi:MAG: hypothetical protein ACFFDS_00125 [Candidatus Thorarchaeota archaeon]
MEPESEKTEINDENLDDTLNSDTEEVRGRDRGKIFLGILFIFIVVVIWYLIELLA